MTRRRAILTPVRAGPLSQRDQALLKLSRLLAENQPPDPDAPEAAGETALIDICELAETNTNLTPPPRRPFRPAGRSLNPLLWRVLEVLIVLVVVVWVFLLGVLVGRSRLGEDGRGLAGWLEKKIGWEAPTVILKPAPEVQPVWSPAETKGPPPIPSAVLEANLDEPDQAEVFEGDAALAPGPEPPAAEPEVLFSVQAALAYDETEARGLTTKLETQGFTSYFYQSGRRFPVRVGPFTSRAEAEDARGQLENLGYNKPYVSELR